MTKHHHETTAEEVAAVMGAAVAAAVKVMRPMLEAQPNRLLNTLKKFEVEQIISAAVFAFDETRRKVALKEKGFHDDEIPF